MRDLLIRFIKISQLWPIPPQEYTGNCGEFRLAAQFKSFAILMENGMTNAQFSFDFRRAETEVSNA